RWMQPVEFHQEELGSEIFVEASVFADKEELVRENLAMVIEDGFIDLEESVIDNIMLGIQMHILSEEELASVEMLSVNHWTVLTEEQYDALQDEKKKANNPFASLGGLFDDE